MRLFAAAVVLTLVVAPARAASDVALTPYIGGRVVTHTEGGGPFWDIFASEPETTYTYQWPGVYFEARFNGPTVDVRVDDAEDNLYLVVDGAHKLTLTRPGKATVALTDLGPGPHTVRLEKSSETQSATGRFDGFFVEARANALPPPAYDRRIEFIGDSFTVGYGDTSRGQTCTVDDVRDTTDTALAFAPAVSKRFNAAYRILAYSGRGIVRNYNGIVPRETLPVLYGYTLFDKSVPAPDDGWTPDVVVIGLGTNDFSTPLNTGEAWATREALRADFIANYVKFVQSIRAKWPGAHIILMASTGVYDDEIIGQVKIVGDQLKSAGETNTEVLPFGGLDYMACHGHPSLKDEAILTNLLVDRISLLPGFAAAKP